MKTRMLKYLLWVSGGIIGLPALYFLSLGPVGWLVSHGVLPDEPLHSIYRPLMATGILGLDGLSERYYDWWVSPQPFYCGGAGDIVPATSESNTTTNK
jgi:hypothetical protein